MFFTCNYNYTKTIDGMQINFIKFGKNLYFFLLCLKSRAVVY